MEKSEIAPIVSAYYEGTLKESITVSSTADSCIFSIARSYPPGSPSSVTIFVESETQLENELQSYANQGYCFSLEGTYTTRSIHQKRLRDARRKLLEIIGQKKPPVYDVQTAISNIGIALNTQINKDKMIQNNKSVGNNINSKLKAIGLERDNLALYNKDKNLNKFYNATKHSKEEENIRHQEMLNSENGIVIALDYYETVRQIFIWYYKKTTAKKPMWEELNPMLLVSLHKDVAYDFDINRMW